jgi:hypothetical protein
MIAQKVINRTWHCAMAFKLYQLRDVCVVDTVFMDGSAHKNLFGWCNISTGHMQIRVTSHHEIPRRLSDACIIDTIAHELAHFIEFRHGPDHRALRNALKTFIVTHWASLD